MISYLANPDLAFPKVFEKKSKIIIFLCFMLAQAKPNGGGSPAFFSVSGGKNTNNFSGSMTMNGTAKTNNCTNSIITNNALWGFLDLKSELIRKGETQN